MQNITSNSSELQKGLIGEIVSLIDGAKSHVAREYNSAQVMLCWLIGKRINIEILKSDRADYGSQIIEQISDELRVKYGNGYSRPNLFKMIKLAKLFPDQEIVSTVSRQLSWSHLILICAIDDSIQREFYIEMCRINKWSVRGLKQQIDSMLFERTSISKKPELVIQESMELLKEDVVTPEMIFKDPYFLNFTQGKDSFSEEELETLIISNITDFLQELGNNFCFVARQKRMSTGKKDRYLDLLFFERRMQRLIAIDLKIGSFDPAYKGQMEWYLNWLDKNERLPHEQKPIGIILCTGKDQEDIAYLEMDQTGIHVAEYMLGSIPKNILEDKLKNAILLAKENYIKNLQLK